MGLVEVKLEPEGRVWVKLQGMKPLPRSQPRPLSGFGGPRKKPLLINIATSTEVRTDSFWGKPQRGQSEWRRPTSLSRSLPLARPMTYQ